MEAEDIGNPLVAARPVQQGFKIIRIIQVPEGKVNRSQQRKRTRAAKFIIQTGFLNSFDKHVKVSVSIDNINNCSHL